MTERSYNGWAASSRPNDIGIAPFEVAGINFPPGVRSGHVTTVLRYVAAQYHRRVEPLMTKPGCWGYAYRKNRNADNLSCHASGTAIDINAPLHPNGKRNTFSAGQVAEIRKILDEVGGVVRWGGDFSGTPDEMHFEIKATPAEVAAVASRLAAPKATKKEPTMTPAQEAKLDKILDILEALVRPRAKDKADHDPGQIDLGDVLTKIEKETP